MSPLLLSMLKSSINGEQNPSIQNRKDDELLPKSSQNEAKTELKTFQLRAADITFKECFICSHNIF